MYALLKEIFFDFFSKATERMGLFSLNEEFREFQL